MLSRCHLIAGRRRDKPEHVGRMSGFELVAQRVRKIRGPLAFGLCGFVVGQVIRRLRETDPCRQF